VPCASHPKNSSNGAEEVDVRGAITATGEFIADGQTGAAESHIVPPSAQHSLALLKAAPSRSRLRRF